MTNQELTLTQRSELSALPPECFEVGLYHLERCVALLDRPRMSPVRRQFHLEDTEPLPGRMLETIEALQEAGALERRQGLFGSPDLGHAVRQLSDILFLPADRRAALFSESSAEDPTEPAEKPFQFGFASTNDEGS